MSAAIAVSGVNYTRRRKIVELDITFSSTYATGGETIDLTTATNAKMIGNAGIGSLPSDVEICNAPGGYSAEWVLGTTTKNGKVMFYSAPGTQLSAGAYPAAITGSKMRIRCSGKVGSF